MKKYLILFLSVLVIIGVFTGCATSEPAKDTKTDAAEPAMENDGAGKGEMSDKKFKVGITIQSLENSFWAGVFGEVEKLIKEKGWDYTILSCEDNSAKQISQIGW